MSAASQTHAAGHDDRIDPRNVHGFDDHGHDHGHGHDDGMPHVSFKGYMTGFILSVILTAIPFWLVMDKVIANNKLAMLVVLAFAVVQIVIHVIYFLHLDTSSEGGWNMLALIFTIVLVVIALIGSLWVMNNMNVNMMPPSPQSISNMP